MEEIAGGTTEAIMVTIAEAIMEIIELSQIA